MRPNTRRAGPDILSSPNTARYDMYYHTQQPELVLCHANGVGLASISCECQALSFLPLHPKHGQTL